VDARPRGFVTEGRIPPTVESFDVVGVAVGTALMSGALAVIAPELAALTGSLAALAWAGWIGLVRPTTTPLRQLLRGNIRWAIASSGVGVLLFLLAPPWAASFRALGLGLSLVPLWRVAGRTSVGVP
jgi:hypothetical protein